MPEIINVWTTSAVFLIALITFAAGFLFGAYTNHRLEDKARIYQRNKLYNEFNAKRSKQAMRWNNQAE